MAPLASAFDDHGQALWDRLLRRHVIPIDGGVASRVDYTGLRADLDSLEAFLAATSSVSISTFNEWDRRTQLAFLINCYNAWTISLVLSAYPTLKSIKDLGTLLTTPWEHAFIPLLGAVRSLDDIEHNLIRRSPHLEDPRVHFAINCASIGCPALQAWAFTGEHLDRQLDSVTSAFLADRQRNRLDGDTLWVSPIFDWYEGDFESGWRGTKSVGTFLAHYANSLDLSQSEITRLLQGQIGIDYSLYDWRLNDIKTSIE